MRAVAQATVGRHDAGDNGAPAESAEAAGLKRVEYLPFFVASLFDTRTELLDSFRESTTTS